MSRDTERRELFWRLNNHPGYALYRTGENDEAWHIRRWSDKNAGPRPCVSKEEFDLYVPCMMCAVEMWAHEEAWPSDPPRLILARLREGLFHSVVEHFPPMALVGMLAEKHADDWREDGLDRFVHGLVEEVGELLGAIHGSHEDSITWELLQIASIALNTLCYIEDHPEAAGEITWMRRAHGRG